jgi:ADP-ribose pyrophosphatase YjhB (NUDIX family)
MATSAFLIAEGPSGILLGYKKHKKHWALPGGRLEAGESRIKGLLRECMEELGLSIQAHQLCWLPSCRTEDGDICHFASINLRSLPEPKCAEFSRTRFFPEDDIPDTSKKTRLGLRAAQRFALAA